MTTDVSPVRLERVVIRFAGDSGDGLQLAGERFTSEAAGLGKKDAERCENMFAPGLLC